MRTVTSVEIYPDYYAFYIYDGEVGSEVLMDTTPELSVQGFYCSSNLCSFATLSDCLNIYVEIRLGEASDIIDLKPNTVRAFLMPYSVGENGVFITNNMGSIDQYIDIPAGNYALVAEIGLWDNPEYLYGEAYRDQRESAMSYEFSRLSFYPSSEDVPLQILRIDTDWIPPYTLSHYQPLNPPDPLIMGNIS